MLDGFALYRFPPIGDLVGWPQEEFGTLAADVDVRPPVPSLIGLSALAQGMPLWVAIAAGSLAAVPA